MKSSGFMKGIVTEKRYILGPVYAVFQPLYSEMKHTVTNLNRGLARGVLLFILSFSAFLWSCKEAADEEQERSTTILVSFDGFRWDYLDRADTPNLDYLVQNGVRAKALIPVFPSKTFPNHISIITGQYPENHGIVSNRMYDPLFDALFWIGEESEPARDGRWYEGEPIWVTAEKQGSVSATMFWPASDAEIDGVRPTYWSYYDGTITNIERVNKVLEWLDLPSGQRPDFITLYFSDTDAWGHEYGPEAAELDSVIGALDGTIGALLDSLRIREYLDRINLILVSDHGMTGVSRERVVFLDDYIDLENATIVDWSPVTAILPAEGLEDAIYHALDGAHPNLSVYRKEEIPERFHYRNHRRITPVICLADEGWSVTSHDYFDAHPDAHSGGDHGYDNRLTSMRGIFIAYGPAFKDGLMVEPFKNIHIYELVCQILKLNPAQNDGSVDSVRALLEEE